MRYDTNEHANWIFTASLPIEKDLYKLTSTNLHRLNNILTNKAVKQHKHRGVNTVI